MPKQGKKINTENGQKKKTVKKQTEPSSAAEASTIGDVFDVALDIVSDVAEAAIDTVGPTVETCAEVAGEVLESCADILD